MCQLAFAEANHPRARRLPGGGSESTLFLEGASMRKNIKRVPSALKHGIYSGLELLPTESPARFRKFKKQIFAELNLVGRLEEDVGDEIVRLEWRRQNLFTYDLAKRVRERRNSIYAQFDPPWSPCITPSLPLLQSDDPPEPLPPRQRAARRK